MSMKKAKPGASSPQSVDAYLAKVPEPARSTLEKVRAAIRSVVPPEATECISYQMPAFRYKGVLVSYGAFSDHCSLFPMGSAVLDALADELKPYRTSKGTLQFPLDKPMPAALLKKIVKARVAQNEIGKTRRPRTPNRER